MTKRELTGRRDLAYSHWHRGHWGDGPGPGSTYQDVDGLEYCHSCGTPLLLKETAHASGDRLKSHKGLLGLAKKTGDVPAVLVFVEPGSVRWCDQCRKPFTTVHRLFIRYVWPERTAEREMTAGEWAVEIDRYHTDHRCKMLV
jgi:hypothetical protein